MSFTQFTCEIAKDRMLGSKAMPHSVIPRTSSTEIGTCMSPGYISSATDRVPACRIEDLRKRFITESITRSLKVRSSTNLIVQVFPLESVSVETRSVLRYSTSTHLCANSNNMSCCCSLKRDFIFSSHVSQLLPATDEEYALPQMTFLYWAT